MDQKKIGAFIAQCRKEKKLTQKVPPDKKTSWGKRETV